MSQDDITPQRPDYSHEPPPRELDPLPPRPVSSSSSVPWLIPLVVVGAVLGLGGCVVLILMALLFPAVSKVREASARSHSVNNLRQVGLAMHNCNDTFGEIPQVSGRWIAEGGNTERTLFVNLLPYLEQDFLYQNIVKGNATPNQLVKTLVSPADTTGNGANGECSYAANWQVFQLTPPGAPGEVSYASIPRSMPDGLTNIIAFAEIYQNCNGTVRRWGQTGKADNFATPAFNRMAVPNPKVLNTQLQLPQTAPSPADCAPPLAQTPHRGGILVGLADSSVRSVQPSISLVTWQRACSPADGNMLGNNDW